MARDKAAREQHQAGETAVEAERPENWGGKGQPGVKGPGAKGGKGGGSGNGSSDAES